MAINFSTGFDIRSIDPVDRRFILSKREMYEERYTSDNTVIALPPKYFCICKDDNNIYYYDADNIKESGTGKFRPLSTEAFVDVLVKGIVYASLSHDGKPVQVQSAIEDGQGNNIADKIGQISGKQDKLIAGPGISIDSNNIISNTLLEETYTKNEINQLAQQFGAAINEDIQMSANSVLDSVYRIATIIINNDGTIPSASQGNLYDAIFHEKDIKVNDVRYSYIKQYLDTNQCEVTVYGAIDFDPITSTTITKIAEFTRDDGYYTAQLHSLNSSAGLNEGYIQF